MNYILKLIKNVGGVKNKFINPFKTYTVKSFSKLTRFNNVYGRPKKLIKLKMKTQSRDKRIRTIVVEIIKNIRSFFKEGQVILSSI